MWIVVATDSRKSKYILDVVHDRDVAQAIAEQKRSKWQEIEVQGPYWHLGLRDLIGRWMAE